MFKSFYKIHQSSVFSDTGLKPSNSVEVQQYSNDVTTSQKQLKRVNNNVWTTNLLVVFVTLFSIQYTNSSKRTAHPSSLVHVNNNLKFVVSFFFLPKRKKNVIFLRAPYKNKMARLNILNLEYTFIVSIRTNTKDIIATKAVNLLTNQFANFNLSSTKLKHTKTVVSANSINVANFNLVSFLRTV